MIMIDSAVKYGGSSVETGEALRQSFENAETQGHRAVTASAPGGVRDGELISQRITMQSVAARKQFKETGELPPESIDNIVFRFEDCVDGVSSGNMDKNWRDRFRGSLDYALKESDASAFVIGEILMAEIWRCEGGYQVIDPRTAPKSLWNEDPGEQRDLWRSWLDSTIGLRERREDRFFLIGNLTSSGRVLTMGPGGTDTSGALFAYGLRAGRYVNSTDTRLMTTDPKLLKQTGQTASFVPEIGYNPFEDLARFGSGIVNQNAIVPLIGSGIDTYIQDTFKSEDGFTAMRDNPEGGDDNEPKAMSLMSGHMVVVHEAGLVNRRGWDAKRTEPLAEEGINLNDIAQEGSSHWSIMVDPDDSEKARAILERMKGKGAGSVAVRDVAMVTLVGNNLGKVGMRVLGKWINGGVFEGVEDVSVRPAPHSIGVIVPGNDGKRVALDTHALFFPNNSEN